MNEGDIALQVAANAEQATAWELLSGTCPDVTRLLRALGEPVDPASLDAFARSYGAEHISHLLDREYVTLHFARLWRTAKARRDWELLEILLLEHWLSTAPRAVALHLPTGIQLPDLLHSVRSSIALALYARAKDLNWREPLTFVRALQMSERYLRWSVANCPADREPTRIRLEGRLGVCMVLRSRFEDLSAEELNQAADTVSRSLIAGSALEGHEAYYAEARLRLFGASPDPEILLELERWFCARTVAAGPVLSALRAELWLRLGESAKSLQASIVALERSVEYSGSVSGNDVLATVHAMVVRGLAQARLDRQRAAGDRVVGLSLNGLRFPFGLKQQARLWLEVDRIACVADLESVAAILASCTSSVQSHPLCRKVRASVLSTLAVGDGSQSRRLHRLGEATALRSSGRLTRSLNDPESRLENAVDLVSIFEITKRQDALLASVAAILELTEFDQAWATPLVLLAQLVEQISPIGLELAYALGRLEVRQPQAQLVRRQVVAGDAAGLYASAAARALESREIDRKVLGGRSGAYIAADFSGVMRESFVFKPTTLALAEREDGRAHALRRWLERRGLGNEFSVAQTLARTELPADDALRERNYEVLVARQYHQGQILAERLQSEERTPKLVALERAIDFLAIIHASEFRQEPLAGARARKELRKQEFGRWLRDGLRLADSRRWFDAWFDAFPLVPMLPRRDAHAFNWLITGAGELVALDLEASGWRPLCYEVAQLLDDFPLLPSTEEGWRDRRRLVRRYARALVREGVSAPTTDAQQAFDLSVIARAVRSLTDPAGGRARRAHGESLLRHLASGSGAVSAHAPALAECFLSAWTKRSGAATGTGLQVTDARRRHLSRAMAYELRHGDAVNLDDQGWGYLAAVSDALNRSGFVTSKPELEAVASAVDELRFELRDNNRQVRARYGHTRLVDISYPTLGRVHRLFHGTSTDALASIFDRGEGLSPRGRLWVHLSDDAGLAARTAQRHGPGVLLSLDPMAPERVTVRHAGGTTYLASAVPAHELRIVTLLHENALGLPLP